jgi:cytochrome oxidase Cu insertion factor (SCO1/SenC/PrrC family)
MTRREALALSALAAILAVTAAWWALALWPAGAETPAWVVQTRAVCFGTRPDGLPGPAGWLVLVGEPIGMLGFLLAAWGRDVRDGLRALGRSLPGRALLAGGGMALVLGSTAAAARVAAATTAGEAFDPAAGAAAAPERLDRPAPPLRLVDHRGGTTDLAAYRGRPVIVAFAYGHCQTVCPTLVHEAVAALALTQGDAPALLVVTLDPWRDRPERLPAIAAGWELPANARLLGGSVEGVEAVLDAWNVVRERDPDTGDIIHPTRVYVVDPAGRLAWAAEADARRLAVLLTADAAPVTRHPE